jgi:hypothetical protein
MSLLRDKFSFTAVHIHIGSFKAQVLVLPLLIINATSAMMCLTFCHKEGVARFLHIAGNILPDYMASHS